MRSPRRLPWAESFLVLALLAGTVAVAWTGFGEPPSRLLLRYGLPPGGSPTGRECDLRGLRFVEVSPGYFLARSPSALRASSPPARFGPVLGLSRRRPRDGESKWVVRPEPFWISAAPVTNREFEALYPDRERDPPDADPDDPVLGRTGRRGDSLAELYARWLGLGTDREVRVATEEDLAWARALGLIPETEQKTLRLAFGP